MKLLVSCCLLLLAAALAAAHAQTGDRALIRAAQKVDMSRRVALVIGNAAYSVQPLANPVIDARSMDKALREFGFDVTLVTDADRTRSVQALSEFRRKLAGAGVALFYFAGHGVQLEGMNYLVPVGVSLEQEEQIRYNTIKLDDVLDALGSADAQLRIVILDACRNNPFQRSRGGSGGLASPGQAPFGTLIAYATSPGRVAADGKAGENGLYTRQLLQAMREPGRPLEDVFKITRSRVAAASGGQQIPWETTSLSEGAFYFKEGAPTERAGVAVAGEAQAFRGLARTERPKQLSPGTAFRDCERCPEMVVVAGGSFEMGSPESEPQRQVVEGPQRGVTLAAPFAVGRFEVTFEQWEACLLDKEGCDRWPNDGGRGRGQHPVVDVSWDDANRYVAWLSRHTGKKYRLLSEAEWEYVARAGTPQARPWGADIGAGKANCDGCGETRAAGALPVGRTPANPWKVHEMLGNVWEWVADCTNSSYTGAPTDGTAWVTGDCSRRVLRGGAWTTAPRGVRTATRAFFPAGRRDVNIGFRVATSIE